jgi:hypothetical protein
MENMPYKVGDIIEINPKAWSHLDFYKIPVIARVETATPRLSTFILIDNAARTAASSSRPVCVLTVTRWDDYNEVYVRHVSDFTLDYKLKSKHRF